MTTELKLSAQVREKLGKNVNRRLRASGLTPAVFYIAGEASVPVSVNEAALNKLYASAGRTSVFTLEINDKGKKSTHSCLVWDAEYYPTKNRFQHVDFYGVDMGKELKIQVPLEFVGTAKGTKLGGRLEVYREQIFILSKPSSLPKKITVDVSNLDVGQSLRVQDLTMPEGVRASFDTNFAILTVSVPGAAKDDSEEGAI
jgi:large subunit ribosomal protein L25